MKENTHSKVFSFSLYREGLAQLGEVFDGTNHLRGVGVLVIIPRNNLNLIGVVSNLQHHGLGSIEQRTVTHTHDVGGYDLVGVVTEGLGGLSLHSSVDGLNGHFLVGLDDSGQDGGGTGGGGNTLCRAEQHENDAGRPFSAGRPESSGRRCKRGWCT